MPKPTLTANQKRFVADAKKQGLKVYAYSGRFMYGKECPSVRVQGVADFRPRARYLSDQLGRGFVIYAPD